MYKNNKKTFSMKVIEDARMSKPKSMQTRSGWYQHRKLHVQGQVCPTATNFTTSLHMYIYMYITKRQRTKYMYMQLYLIMQSYKLCIVVMCMFCLSTCRTHLTQHAYDYTSYVNTTVPDKRNTVPTGILRHKQQAIKITQKSAIKFP